MGKLTPAVSDGSNRDWKKYRAIITDFLRRANIPIETLHSPSREAVEKLVLDYTKEWEKMGLTADRWRPYYKVAIDLGAVGYGHTRVDVQAQIALFSILGMCIDEFVACDEALDGFTDRLLSGERQLDPLLDCMVDNLSRMRQFYPPYASKCITLSTIEFIDSTLHDKDVVGMKLHAAALPYVNFKRMHNGIASAYAFFIWDKFSFPDVNSYIQIIPEVMIYDCLCNDVLSFYKEEIQGERDNYIHNRALVTSKGTDAALSDVIDEVVRSIDSVRVILQGEKEKDTWEVFLKNYTAFHYMTSRYKLSELLDSEAVLF